MEFISHKFDLNDRWAQTIDFPRKKKGTQSDVIATSDTGSQEPILQNSISAETFSDKFTFPVFGQKFHPSTASIFMDKNLGFMYIKVF
jgi:hypothetical protein